MAQWRILGGTFAVALILNAPLPAQTPEVNIGVYQTMFPDITPKMLAALSGPLKATVEKTVGLSGGAVLTPDADTLGTYLDQKKVQTGVFLGYEFAWTLQGHPDLVPLVLAVPTGGDPLQAVIVVNADNPAKSIADLKDQSVVIAKLTKHHCRIYLDDLRKGLPVTTAAVLEKKTLVTEEVLAEIAAGTLSAAVVDAAGFRAYSKINTGNAAALKVIATSESFPFAVLAIHKDGLSPELQKRVVDGLLHAHENGTGKAMMMLWGLKDFEEVPADYKDQLVTIVKRYPAPKIVVGTLTGLEKNGEKK